MRRVTVVSAIVLLSVVGTVACRAGGAGPRPEHGLQYTEPATVWDEAMPLGNGLLGALVWGDGKPLRISLDRTDLWDLRPVPEYESPDYSYKVMRQWVKEERILDLHRLYDDPYGNPGPTKIPAGRIELTFDDGIDFEDASLDLAKAAAEMRFGGDAAVEVFVHAKEPLGVIRITSGKPREVKLIAPPFAGKVTEEAGANKISAGDLATLRYKAPVEQRGDTWAGYLQEGWGGFRFAVALVWRQSESGWLGVWSVATSKESGDPLTTARTRCEDAIERGFDALSQGHSRWWRSYWDRASVSVPNAVIERQWYLETYKFGSAAREDTPPITLQGPWTADDRKIPPWKGDYHHDLNTELSYWPAYSGNRLEEAAGYVRWLWDTRENARAWTKRFFDLPGLNVPMTADLEQNQIGGWHQYTHSATTAAWLSHHFWLQWRYSMDQKFLRERTYPWFKDVAMFLEAVTEKGPDGKRTLPLSASPEINDNRLDAWFPSITNYDASLIRWTFERTAEMADLLGEKQRGRSLAKCPGGDAGPGGRSDHAEAARGERLSASGLAQAFLAFDGDPSAGHDPLGERSDAIRRSSRRRWPTSTDWAPSSGAGTVSPGWRIWRHGPGTVRKPNRLWTSSRGPSAFATDSTATATRPTRGTRISVTGLLRWKATSPPRPACRRCFCKATAARFASSRRSRRPGATSRSRACERKGRSWCPRNARTGASDPWRSWLRQGASCVWRTRSAKTGYVLTGVEADKVKTQGQDLLIDLRPGQKVHLTSK